MKYVSETDETGKYIVVDSETGEFFTVMRELVLGERKSSVKWYLLDSGKPFDMSRVLGYVCDDHVGCVSKYLVNLLRYIDCIDYLVGRIYECINVSTMSILDRSEDNVMILLTFGAYFQIHSILEAIVYASYNEKFWRYVQTGYLVLSFGEREFNYLRVKFRTGHLSFLSKLVFFYRETNLFKEHIMSGRGLK